MILTRLTFGFLDVNKSEKRILRALKTAVNETPNRFQALVSSMGSIDRALWTTLKGFERLTLNCRTASCSDGMLNSTLMIAVLLAVVVARGSVRASWRETDAAHQVLEVRV